MTDRELLELAAKAAGMPPTPKGEEIPGHIQVVFSCEGRPWNPLADDGDALRLAVVLGVEVWPINDIEITKALPLGLIFDEVISEKHGNDKYAATRRAIVRAAAEIGKAMP